MDLNWLTGLLYGLVSGFTEFLPVSSETHRMLLRQLMGMTQEDAGLRLAVHAGALLGLVLACWPEISRMRREQRLASIPPRRRRRQPDIKITLMLRMLKTAAVPLLLSFLFYGTAGEFTDILWLHCVFLVANGIVLYIPQFMLRGNKDAQTLSALDATLIGFGGALAVIPGLSGMGISMSVAQMRGADRRFAAELCLLLSIPALAAACLLDTLALITAQAGAELIPCLTAAAAACLSGYLGVLLVRYLSAKAGFIGFSYYSWGAALFALVLYLTII